MAGRVVVYIDGFNLYNGLKDKHGRKYMWLDLQRLAARLLLPEQQLVRVNYFSARIRGAEPSADRQAAYIDALTAHCLLLEVVEGRFQEKRVDCRNCGHRRVSPASC
ncbi:MAG: hypothetical protein V7637_6153 [Mycobacteriales bacterium]|jgi:hypothetical protein